MTSLVEPDFDLPELDPDDDPWAHLSPREVEEIEADLADVDRREAAGEYGVGA